MSPPEGLICLMPVEPALVALLSLSHLIIRFLLVENLTWEANPCIEVNPQLEDNPQLSHPMDKIYLQPWSSIETILPKVILNRLGGNSLNPALSYPLVQAKCPYSREHS